MLKITTNAHQVSLRLGKWAAKVGPAGRRQLYSAAANAVAIDPSCDKRTVHLAGNRLA